MDGNLTFIDRFGIHLSFKSFLNTPPGSPAAGDCYVVDTAPTGVWVGKTGQVAVYDDGAWRYGVPRTGWQAYCEADEGRYVFDGAWNQLAVGDISGLTAALGAKADLVGGVVPSNQLPSYVDDVIEVADFASLPATGETGKIYVTLADNNSWRWTGSTYQKVSQPLDEMPQAVAEAGTSETLYAATSRRIRQAIDAWWTTASSAFGRTLANVVDAAAGRTALGISNHNLVAVDATGNLSLPPGKSFSGAGTASGGFSISTAFAGGSVGIIGRSVSGAAYCSIDPTPLDGTSGGRIRVFRNTNTTADASFSIHTGDGSADLNHVLYGKGGSSYLCRVNGNLLVGKNTDGGTYKLQVNGSLTASGPVCIGQYTLSTLPSASVFAGALIDVTDATGGPKTCRSDGTNWNILNTTTTVS
jgi:hypothetical protein